MRTFLIFEGLLMGKKEGAYLAISNLTLPAEGVAQGPMKMNESLR